MSAYSGHHNEFFSRLYYLQQGGLFTDVKVTTAGQMSFDCHRIVLSAMSPFVETMLQTDMMEQITGEIPLLFDDDCVEAVLKYIYTGENILTEGNVFSVYQAAHLWQVSSLVTMCEEFLTTGLSVQNCLGIWKLSILLGRDSFAEVAKVCVLQNFTELSTADAFESAELGLEDLKMLLKDPLINCSSATKCNAAIIWLTLREEIDRETVYDLLSFLLSECIVSVENLRSSLDQDNYTLWNSLPGDQDTLTRRNTYLEVVRHLASETTAATSTVVQERTDDAYIILGGNHMKSSTFMMALNLRDQKWYSLAALPEDPGYHFAICCVGTRLYLSGGSKRNATFLQYDIMKNDWDRLPDMSVGREGHGMADVNNAIYIFGGDTEPAPCASHIHMYIPGDGTWKKVGEMANPVNLPSHCVLNGTIYIFGGSMIGSTSPSDWTQCFETRTGHSWNLEFKLPFRSKASTLSAVGLSDKIYFVYKGGIYSMRPKEEAQKVYTILSGHQNGASATTYGDKILIIGGEDENFRILDTVFLFNPATNQGMALSSTKTPWPLASFHSAKITFPSALVHGLKEVRPSDGAIHAIGF